MVGDTLPVWAGPRGNLTSRSNAKLVTSRAQISGSTLKNTAVPGIQLQDRLEVRRCYSEPVELSICSLDSSNKTVAFHSPFAAEGSVFLH